MERIHILAVVNGLRSRGHHVSILSPPGADPAVGTIPAETPNPVWAVVSSGMPQLVFELLELVYNAVGGWRMWKHLRSQPVDVLYERYALFLFVGVAVCRFKGIPVVLEVNDSAFLTRVRPIYNRWLARWVESWVFKKSDALITVTEAFKRILVSTGVDASKVFVIHNAAKEEMFSPDISGKTVRQRYGLGDDTVVVGFVGKVVPWHGVDCLIQVAPKIVDEFKNVRFLIVGDTDGERSILELARVLDVQKTVCFTGQVSHEDVPSYLGAMDIAVMPNSNEFGSPVKIFEYMAMGRAIIAPRRGPVEEVLTHGETALIIEPSKPDDLAEALRVLIGNHELRRRLGAAARNVFLTYYTCERNNDRTIAVLQKVIQTRNAIAR